MLEIIRVKARSAHAMIIAMVVVAMLSVVSPARGADAVDYVRDVKPILSEHCYKCHGPDKQTHQLRLDQRAWVMRGGDSGEPTVRPGDAAGSHMIERLTSNDSKLRMPRDADPLTPAQIDTIRRWIDAGAPMPGDDTLEYRLATDHWSFQPMRSVDVPTVDGPVTNAIDAFVLAKLRKKNLSMSAEADRRTLIRRVYMVMHGLPPAPEEVDAFVSDTTPDAYDRLIERVLASPRYGERWAQHWLDIARYADTNGFEMNQPRNNAYLYRDWVIAALNNDKPYDRFVFEQLAGDTVGEDAATGFMVAGAWDQVKGHDGRLRVMQRHDEIHDMISTTGATMLGLTVGCARCHNHKFDPVTQSDYYRMEGIFTGVMHGDRAITEKPEDRKAREAQLAATQKQLAALESRRDEISGAESEIDPRRNVDRFKPIVANAVRFRVFATNNGAQPCLDELELWTAGEEGSVNVALASAGARASASGLLPGYAIHKIEHLNDGQHGNDKSWISNTAGTGWAMIELREPAEVDRVIWGRDRDGDFVDRVPSSYTIEVRKPDGTWVAVSSSSDRKPGRSNPDQPETDRQELAKLNTSIDVLKKKEASLRKGKMAYAGALVKPPVTHRLYRGDPFSPREEIDPGVIAVLGDIGLTAQSSNAERRERFANWLIDPKNPLPARVMVNRLWQHHFGTGIVDTPSDFGGNGATPTHPELLDWLAGEFVRSGWSIKHMHRLILKSRTFRQSSPTNAEAMAIDGGARYLWRYPSRRLEAEPIRDSMLQVAGDLDLTMGGPGFSLFEPNNNYVRNYIPLSKWEPAQFRRMVYVHKVRMEGGPVFGAFDCPDAGQPQPRRSRSTTAIQALSLFNSSFTMTLAADLAERVHREAGDDIDAQIDRIYQLALGRHVDDAALRILRPVAEEHGVSAVARVVFNTNEFLFIP